ncbi:hypothetical protein AGMMS49592_0600 [Endomicrobiia bacterium]|nr:hypothetical protein AGMMS49592_0600 [Endomicrobiia bacterium]
MCDLWTCEDEDRKCELKDYILKCESFNKNKVCGKDCKDNKSCDYGKYCVRISSCFHSYNVVKELCNKI